MFSEEQVINVEFLPNDIVDGATYIIKQSNPNSYTHGMFKYPCKFIPEIPRWGIKKYSKKENTIVFDPFSGSGTTLLEANINGLNAYGTEIDDIAKLIIKVKTTRLDNNQINELDKICPKHTILSSNTSSLSLSKLIENISVERKKRIMICHWYNPAHLIPIIELSYFGNMPEEIFSEVYNLYLSIEKQPINVKKDISGMIANRMLHALAREAFHLIEIDAVSPEDIEKALKYGPGFRSATTGILESADLGGLDIWCTVEDNLFRELNNSKKASDLLKQKVNNGKLGLKTEEGFFKYSKEIKEKIKKDFFRRLIIQLKASKNY